MPFWSTIWDAIWWFITAFIFIAYLMALFSIITDLFRDRELNGFLKAVWLIFLIFLPFLTALVYLIVRGKGMGERQVRQAEQLRAASDAYVRSVAGGSPTSDIAEAKKLLDAGAITAEEYAKLKSDALARLN
ncbi:MAG: SHOCT domain-containing protein [Micropruina sp.]|nr:SHOCT domain-containing protein [Micropruina sp.]